MGLLGSTWVQCRSKTGPEGSNLGPASFSRICRGQMACHLACGASSGAHRDSSGFQLACAASVRPQLGLVFGFIGSTTPWSFGPVYEVSWFPIWSSSRAHRDSIGFQLAGAASVRPQLGSVFSLIGSTTPWSFGPVYFAGIYHARGRSSPRSPSPLLA